MVCTICVLASSRLFGRDCNRNESDACRGMHASSRRLAVMLGEAGAQTSGPPAQMIKCILLEAFLYNAFEEIVPSWCILFILYLHLIGCVAQPPGRCMKS